MIDPGYDLSTVFIHVPSEIKFKGIPHKLLKRSLLVLWSSYNSCSPSFRGHRPHLRVVSPLCGHFCRDWNFFNERNDTKSDRYVYTYISRSGGYRTVESYLSENPYSPKNWCCSENILDKHIESRQITRRHTQTAAIKSKEICKKSMFFGLPTNFLNIFERYRCNCVSLDKNTAAATMSPPATRLFGLNKFVNATDTCFP